jgi:H+/Cl- antiporter ClcA
LTEADSGGEPAPAPELELADEGPWYAEHTALLISTLKWALLGAGAGVCVGLGSRIFLWALRTANLSVGRLTLGPLPYYALLPAALPLCVWLVRRFAPDAKGHGTEAVIAAVHQRSGRIEWKVAPIKLAATIVTLAFGGSVGKEGPCAQIGAAITSFFADVLRLSDDDRRRLVICGIGAGFASVFGTPVSGALFGIEVLYLGRIDYGVLFPCLVAGIVGHLVCGAPPPVPALHESFGQLGQTTLIGLSLLFGAVFGLMALLLIEAMRALEKFVRRFEAHPYRVAAAGGIFLAAFYSAAGDVYAGLGTATIADALAGTARVAFLAFLFKIISTAVTLETGGSGGIVTPIFFIGTTGGFALAQVFGLPSGAFAAFGFVAVLAAAANTPIAAAVMGMELLPGPVGVYAALCAGTAFLIVGHRSVYASQKLGFSKSAGLEMELEVPIGEVDRAALRVRPGSLTERALRAGRPGKSDSGDPAREPRIRAAKRVLEILTRVTISQWRKSGRRPSG